MSEAPQMDLHYKSEASDGELEIRLILYVDRGRRRGVAEEERQVRTTLGDNFRKVNFPINGKIVHDRVVKDYDRHYHFYEVTMIADKFVSIMDELGEQGVNVIAEENLDKVVGRQPFEEKGKWYTDRATTLKQAKEFADKFF